MIPIFRTDRFGQTVQTQIRLLLEEQSDQGLHCLLFHLSLTKYAAVWPFCLNFRLITVKFSGVRKFRNFKVHVFLSARPQCLNLRVITAQISVVLKFRTISEVSISEISLNLSQKLPSIVCV